MAAWEFHQDTTLFLQLRNKQNSTGGRIISYMFAKQAFSALAMQDNWQSHTLDP